MTTSSIFLLRIAYRNVFFYGYDTLLAMHTNQKRFQRLTLSHFVISQLQIRDLNSALFQFISIDEYAKDGGPWEVWLFCSFLLWVFAHLNQNKP